MRVKLLAAAVGSILLATLTLSSAQANHSWGGYHWAGRRTRSR